MSVQISLPPSLDYVHIFVPVKEGSALFSYETSVRRRVLFSIPISSEMTGKRSGLNFGTCNPLFYFFAELGESIAPPRRRCTRLRSSKGTSSRALRSPMASLLTADSKLIGTSNSG